MPILDCTVKTCHFNVDERCSLDKIKVEGKDAHTTEGTECHSFKPRKENCHSNVVGMPDAHSKIECSAENCHYNKNHECHAENIGIVGSDACEKRDTECVTFRG